MRQGTIILAAAILCTGAAWQQSGASGAHETHVRAEAARLRAHFDVVDSELRARDVSMLGAQQQDRRAQLIEWLRDYRREGRFPLNDRYAEAAVPIFRDADGTLCAMAYLIDRSGRGDIVDRVAASRNTAYIRDLVDDPELVAWLDAHGLSANEAGRVQPAYNPPQPPEADPDYVGTGYALASMALAGTSLATTYANIAAGTRLSGVLGLVAGGTTTLAGVLRLDEDGGTESIAVANTVVGVFAMGAALHGLRSLGRDGGQRAANEMRVGRADLTITPDVINVADRSRLGLVFQARF